MTLMNGHSANGSRPKPKACLETTVFAALFNQDDEKWKNARDILQDAREGCGGISVP